MAYLILHSNLLLKRCQVHDMFLVNILIPSSVFANLLRQFKCLGLIFIERWFTVSDFSNMLPTIIYYLKLWFLVQFRIDVDKGTVKYWFAANFVGSQVAFVLSKFIFVSLWIVYMRSWSLHLFCDLGLNTFHGASVNEKNLKF